MSEDLKRYRDIMVELFPIMVRDLDRAIKDENDSEDYFTSSNDFLMALVSVNMLAKDHWVQELEEIIEEWQEDTDY